MFVRVRLSFLDIFFIFVGNGLGKCFFMYKVSNFVSGIKYVGIFWCMVLMISGEYFVYLFVMLIYFFFGGRLRFML